ncbi:MAG: PilN domain-containing protein [Acidobacteria bacterium]|nr:PilN domain-containing protein [Acidobacteriota bacterium]
MRGRNWRKWLAIGAGVGIEIRSRQLRVVVVRVRPSGVRVLGATVIEGFGERPAAEWGAEYAAFLKKLGLSHLAAAVLLPRPEAIVRQLPLPAVTDNDLEAAVGYQLESLHPYPENEAAAAWKRIGRGASVLVAIARRAVIERYTGLFTEAGIKIASFTVSAAALYSAVRLLSAPPAGFVAYGRSEEGLEVYGESASHPLFSALFDLPPERALPLAASELRLDPAQEPLPLEQLLPAPRAVPRDFDFPPATLAYATALAGACPRLALAANLLPAEMRQTSSRAIYAPTLALAFLLAVVTGALGLIGALENRRYMERLEAETARFEPQAKRLARMDTEIAAARARTQLMADFRKRTRDDLDALNELTRLLPPPAWLNSLEVTRGGVTLSGETEQAAGLLKTLDASPLFRDSEFTMGISRVGAAEVFRVRSQREGPGR